MEDRCIVCGEIIPEGRMICLQCERRYIKMGMILQDNQIMNDEIKRAFDFIKENRGKE